MKQNKLELTHRQKQAALELAIGKSYQDAGKSVGVSAQTMVAWKKQKVFTDEIERLRQDMIAVAKEKVKQLSTSAIDRLASIMNHPDASLDVARKAAMDLLSLAGMTETSVNIKQEVSTVSTADDAKKKLASFFEEHQISQSKQSVVVPLKK